MFATRTSLRIVNTNSMKDNPLEVWLSHNDTLKQTVIFIVHFMFACGDYNYTVTSRSQKTN